MKRRSEAPVPACRRPGRSASRSRGRRPPRRRAGGARRPGRARSRSPSRGSGRRPSASALWKPARYAGPRPSLCGRWRTETPSSSAASGRRSSPVPSGELSSMTSTCTPSACSARTIRSTFSRSLYVGRQTVAHERAVSSPAMATTLPRNADVADQLDLLADLSEIRGDDCFRVCAYRRAAQRVRETSAPVAELALDGRAKELQGIGKTIEEKIVEIVEDGEIHALTKRKARDPRRGRALHAAARARAEERAEDLEGARGHDASPSCARRRRRSGCARSRAWARRWRRASCSALDAPARGRGAAAHAARPGAAGAAGGRLGARGASGLRPGLDRGQRAALEGDRPRPRHHRDRERSRRAHRLLHEAARGSSRSLAKGPTKATVVSHDGYRFDLRVVPPECYGNLLQHFTGSKDHNVALREAAVRRKLSVSEYGVQNIETGETFTARTEEELYALPRLRLHPAGAARELRRARCGARTARCRSSSSWATSAATSTRTRTGRPTARTRSRRWCAPRSRAATSTTRSPTTRTTCARAGSRRRRRRSPRSRRASRRSGSFAASR